MQLITGDYTKVFNCHRNNKAATTSQAYIPFSYALLVYNFLIKFLAHKVDKVKNTLHNLPLQRILMKVSLAV